MARNIEIKARVHDPAALESRVAALADGPTDLSQDDTFFECAQGRLKLRVFGAGPGELIFYRRADRDGPKESFYLIAASPSPDALREVLAHAYGTRGRVRKQRRLYLAGRTRIHLDRVEGLGDFMELEVVLRDDEAPQAGESEARELMRVLGIGPADLLEGAYLDLLQDAAGKPPATAQ